jgi:hypothetical protein
MLAILPDNDWLGRVGFTHRLMRMKGLLNEIHRKAESQSVQPTDAKTD